MADGPSVPPEVTSVVVPKVEDKPAVLSNEVLSGEAHRLNKELKQLFRALPVFNEQVQTDWWAELEDRKSKLDHNVRFELDGKRYAVELKRNYVGISRRDVAGITLDPEYVGTDYEDREKGYWQECYDSNELPDRAIVSSVLPGQAQLLNSQAAVEAINDLIVDLRKYVPASGQNIEGVFKETPNVPLLMVDTTSSK